MLVSAASAASAVVAGFSDDRLTAAAVTGGGTESRCRADALVVGADAAGLVLRDAAASTLADSSATFAAAAAAAKRADAEMVARPLPLFLSAFFPAFWRAWATRASRLRSVSRCRDAGCRAECGSGEGRTAANPVAAAAGPTATISGAAGGRRAVLFAVRLSRSRSGTAAFAAAVVGLESGATRLC